MPGNTLLGRGSGLADRVRARWEASTFLGDVALAFTAITVVNSLMMLTGLDEPKTATFAYLHLLGRLGIITVVVGLFHLGELRLGQLRDGLTRWRRSAELRRSRLHRSRRAAMDSVLGTLARAPVKSMAWAFTAVVTLTCALTLAFAGVRAPTGGPGLYRNLILLAVLLLVGTIAGSWWRRRMLAPPSDPS